MRSENGSTGRSFVEVARRRQIIDAAIETVAERGYANASLAHIATTAGISKSVISYHFAGKEELLREVVTAVFDECGEAVGAALASCHTWTERLAATITGQLEYLRDHRTRWLAASEIVISHRDESGTPLYLQSGDEEIEGIVEILEAGRDAGEFGAFDVRIAALTVVHGLDGVLTEWQKDESLDLDDYGRRLVAFILRAVRPGPS